ncbi:hypothetical protein Tco_0961373 [Tanacetum coccineum]
MEMTVKKLQKMAGVRAMGTRHVHEVHGLLREFRDAKSQCRVRSAAHGIISIFTSPSIGKKLNIAAFGYNFDRDAEQEIVPTWLRKSKKFEEKTGSQGGWGDSWGKKKGENKPRDRAEGSSEQIKGVIGDGTGRRNKNRRTKAGGRRKRNGFLKQWSVPHEAVRVYLIKKV